MKNFPQLNQPTYQAGLLQSQAYRALSNFMTARLQPYDLSLPEWKLLGYLNQSGPMTASQVARTLSVKRPIGSRLLNSLEAKGLLRRRADKKDSRTVHVDITPAGKRLVERIEKHLRTEMRRFLGDIDRRELAIYIKVLGLLAQKI